MNTFQAIIVADVNETYAVFNYDMITWGTDKRNEKPIVWARVRWLEKNKTIIQSINQSIS